MKMFIVKSLVCLAVLCAVVWVLNTVLPETGELNNKIYEILVMAAKVILGFCSYFAVACLLKMEEALYWIRKVFSRFGTV